MIVKCLTCSAEFNVYPYQIKKGTGKYCSRICWRKSKIGENSQWYKNGESITNGYKIINVLGRGQTREHRYIMEQHIGRELSPDEHVHHINGNKTDNRLENLELLTQKEHARMHYYKDEVLISLNEKKVCIRNVLSVPIPSMSNLTVSKLLKCAV